MYKLGRYLFTCGSTGLRLVEHEAATRGVLLLHLGGILVHHRLLPSILSGCRNSSPVTIDTPVWIEALCE